MYMCTQRYDVTYILQGTFTITVTANTHSHTIVFLLIKLPFSTWAHVGLFQTDSSSPRPCVTLADGLKEFLFSSKRNVQKHFTLDATWLRNIDFHVLSWKQMMQHAVVSSLRCFLFCQGRLSVCLYKLFFFSLSLSLPPSLTLRGKETPVSRLFKSSPLSPAWRLQWKSFRGLGVVKWGTEGGG